MTVPLSTVAAARSLGVSKQNLPAVLSQPRPGLDTVSIAQQGIGDEDMGRRRHQKTGHLFKRGPSWILRWREYAPGEKKGRQVSEAIAPCKGPGAKTRRQAERIAYDEVLARLDTRTTRPSSTMTVEAFIQQKFNVQVVDRQKPSTQKHYAYIVRAFIAPAFGERRMCDVQRDDVEMLVAKVLKDYSPQTAAHVKNAVSRIWRHAKALGCYTGENPAADVDCGELIHDKRPSFTFDQAQIVLASLRSPYREMGWLSIETSMNAAELCGLRRKWANLTAEVIQVEGEVLAPYTVAIRQNWYEGKRGSLKRGKRRRNCPITVELAADLVQVIEASSYREDSRPMFCSEAGTPIDAHNVSNRIFKPLSLNLGFPVTWHSFRRAHSSFAGQVDGVALEDRVRDMGHADKEMTLYYSVEDIERRRRIPEQIRARLAGKGLQLLKTRGA